MIIACGMEVFVLAMVWPYLAPIAALGSAGVIWKHFRSRIAR